MFKNQYCHLKHLDVMCVEGPDAFIFLQGQFTHDLRELQPMQPILGAFCSSNGRAMTSAYIIATGKDTYYIVCHATAAPGLLQHLSKYIVFYRTTRLTYTPQSISIIGAHISLQDMQLRFDKACFVMQWSNERVMMGLTSLNSSDFTGLYETLMKGDSEESLEHWKMLDILERKPWLRGEHERQWVPQNFSLDHLNGISFTKGCYTGQEVIARMHYKGKSKKKLYVVKWPYEDSHSEVNALFRNTRKVGDIVNRARFKNNCFALAILSSNEGSQPLYLDANEQFPVKVLD